MPLAVQRGDQERPCAFRDPSRSRRNPDLAKPVSLELRILLEGAVPRILIGTECHPCPCVLAEFSTNHADAGSDVDQPVVVVPRDLDP